MKSLNRSTGRPHWHLLLLVLIACAGQPTSRLSAQSRVRFPTAADPYATPPTTYPWTTPVAPVQPPGGPFLGTPSSNAGPINAPSVTLGPQIVPFDPYSGGTTVPPHVYQPPANVPPYLPPSSIPAQPGMAPPTGPPPPVYGSTGPPQPAPLFPNGINWNGAPQRLFQDTGFRHTFLAATGDEELGLNETEVFTTVVINRFNRSPDGLRITPGFIFHFLDGPSTGIALPPRLYSAYVQGGWAPQFTPQFGADLRFRSGVYTDFDTVTSHSVRFTGHALGVLQLTPTMVFKLGIEYLDRAKIKLLPAGGILWIPNPQSRFDIYFPRPKFSRYWRTIGSSEVWWHIGGEYGGGSWTVVRPVGGARDRIDINDLRVFAGLEWNQVNARRGFLEVGYVFDREIIFKLSPGMPTHPDNTVMVRGGITF